MFIDVVNAGWIPIYNLDLSDDVIGYTGAPAIALDYPWTHLISGHLGRVATREDIAMHQQYIADIEASSREALASVNPGPIFKHYGENVWAAVRAHLDAVTEHAAAPSSRNTPACWAALTSRSSPGPRRSRSCSRFASTAVPAARSILDHNAPGRSCSGARPGPGSRTRARSFRTPIRIPEGAGDLSHERRFRLVPGHVLKCRVHSRHLIRRPLRRVVTS